MPTDNEILARLLATATAAVETDHLTARTSIERAAALLGIELVPASCTPAQASLPRGGLAPWQAKRVRSYVETHLRTNIRAAELAELVHLSTSHFFRAFRESFAETPRAYLMRRRIQHAQELMLSSRRPLLEIALDCGIRDSGHFTRVFCRIVGVTPTAWRRQFAVDPARRGSQLRP